MNALVVVDMQVACFAGEPPRRDRAGTVARINALARAIRRDGIVVFIQHTDETDYLRSSAGWQLLPELERTSSDFAVEKCACDSFLETELETILRANQVTDVVIAGCATDFCVDTTIRTAAALGFSVIVPCDAHTTRDRPHLGAEKIIEHHNYMWADLILPRRRTVRVVTTVALLAEFDP